MCVAQMEVGLSENQHARRPDVSTFLAIQLVFGLRRQQSIEHFGSVRL
jgi:hypothetical protein